MSVYQVELQKSLQIIGCGPGGIEFMTVGGRHAALSCDCLIGASHLLDLFIEFERPKYACAAHSKEALSQIEQLRFHYTRIGVLVSGDTGLCSLAAPVIHHFGKDSCAVHPGVSSVQVACARLGLDWGRARILSAHAMVPGAVPEGLHRSDLIVVLAGSSAALQWCEKLHGELGASYRVVLCSDLGMAQECITYPASSEQWQASSRTVVVLFKEEVC
jgi:cobalt-precorrin-7 (C5)-methyltransferase